MDIASEYIEGSLTPEERSRMQAHLDGCPSCAGVIADVSRIVYALRGLRRITPSAAFDFVLRGLIRRELYNSRHRRSSILRRLIPERGFPLPVALFAAFMVFFGVFVADGLWQSFSARRSAEKEEVSASSSLASGGSVTDHYVLERTTLEELRAGVGDTAVALGMDYAAEDTTLFTPESRERARLERVRLVTF